MKELKKLSLKEELDREAEIIEEEVGKRHDLDDLTVSEEAETALFNKIQDYEYDKRFKKTVHRSRKKRGGRCCAHTHMRERDNRDREQVVSEGVDG